MENNTDFEYQKKFLQEIIFNSQAIQIDFKSIIIGIIISGFSAYILRIAYIHTSNSLSNKENFSSIFVPLAMATCVVITVIKFSLALSLGLVGALSIVRFRAAIKEPEELVFLFITIAIGIANGANQFLISILSTFLIFIYFITRDKFNKINFFFIKLLKKDIINNEVINSQNNILQIEIYEKSDDIINIVGQFSNYFDSLILRSVNTNKTSVSYQFYFNLKKEQTNNLLKHISKISTSKILISVLSSDIY